MDSFELNKILGAVLFTCLCLVALNITAGAIFSPPKPEKPGYEIAVKEPEGGAKGPAAPAEEPIETLLASADPKRGEDATKPCHACHTFAKGEPNKVGPNLWGVVGRSKASVAGFNYSAAMKAKGGDWSFDELSKFIANPRGYVPGTSMSFAGIARANERANVIAYLRTLSDNPVPLPQAASAPANPQPGNASAQPNAPAQTPPPRQ
jgi:cytochrome c